MATTAGPSIGPQVEIRCGARSFTANAYALCSKSEFFLSLIEGRFKESLTRSVDLQEENSYYVSLMLDFFNNGDYDDGYPNVPFPRDLGRVVYAPTLDDKFRTPEFNETACLWSQLTNISVYSMAEKYLTPDLKNLALNKFKRHSVQLWVRHLPELLESIYTNTSPVDNRLRPYISAVAAGFAYLLDDHEEMELETVLEEIQEASRDVHRASRDKVRSKQWEVETLLEENSLLKANVRRLEAEWDFERRHTDREKMRSNWKCPLGHIGVPT